MRPGIGGKQQYRGELVRIRVFSRDPQVFLVYYWPPKRSIWARPQRRTASTTGTSERPYSVSE